METQLNNNIDSEKPNFFQKYRKHIIIGAIIIGVIALIGLLIWLFTSPSNENKEENKESFSFGKGENPDDFAYSNSWIQSVIGSDSKIVL